MIVWGNDRSTLTSEAVAHLKEHLHLLNESSVRSVTRHDDPLRLSSGTEGAATEGTVYLVAAVVGVTAPP